MNMSVWVYTGKCGACGGRPKYKYRKGEYELKVIPSQKRFSVFVKQKAILTGLISDIKTILDTI